MIFDLKGSIVALVTPFLENGEIDWNSFDQLINFHLENNTDGLVICGTTGETPTLTNEEDEALIIRAIKLANGKIPIIAGSGSNSTITAIEKTKQAEKLGADAALVVVPYYNKPTQSGLIAHYEAVANAVNIPIILYNVPSRSGTGISTDSVLKLIEKCDNIVGIKEAAGKFENFIELISRTPENFRVYSGDDYLSTAANLFGADGCISVVANIIPKEFHELMIESINGNKDKSMNLFYKYKNLMNYCFLESNPIPVKAALSQMNKIKEIYHLPLTKMKEDTKKILLSELKKLEIIS